MLENNWKSHSLLGSEHKMVKLFCKVWQFFIQLDVHLPYNLPIPLLGFYPGEMKTLPHKDLYANLYSSFIHNCPNWKHWKYLSTSEWINCSPSTWLNTTQESKGTSCDRWMAWMYFRCTALSEKSEKQRVTYCMIPNMITRKRQNSDDKRGEIDYRKAQGTFLGWWKYSKSFL